MAACGVKAHLTRSAPSGTGDRTPREYEEGGRERRIENFLRNETVMREGQDVS